MSQNISSAISSVLKNIFLAILLINSFSIANAQRVKTHTLTADEAKIIKKDAATLYNTTNYNSALKGYQDLLKADPKNPDYNYRLGFCYLMTNVNKAKAVEYFEAAIQLKDQHKEATYF